MDSSYNNSFGQFGVGASDGSMNPNSDANGVGPVASGDSGGDIIISSSDGGRGNKRRGLVVVAILLFVVAIGAGLGALLLGQPNSGDDGSSDEASIRSAFNRYANYLLYEHDSTDDISDRNSTSYYSPTSFLEERRDDYKEYCKKAQDLGNEFLEKIKDSKYDDDYYSSVINAQNASLVFIDLYNSIEEPTAEVILEYYKSNDEKSTKSYVEEFYSSFKASDSVSAQNYATFRVRQFSSYVDYLQLLPKSCMEDANQDVCLEEINAKQETIVEIREKMINSNSDAEDIVLGVKYALANNCFTMSERLYDEEE